MVPQAVRDEAARIAAAWRSLVPEARWVQPANLHMTLKFLGDTDRGDDVASSLSVLGAVRAFEVTLSGPGAFPSIRRARVLWLGVNDEAEHLERLAARVDQVVADLGFAPEMRPHFPHLTLARLTHAREVSLPEDPAPLSFPVDRIVLFRSHLGRGGARYGSVVEIELADS